MKIKNRFLDIEVVEGWRWRYLKYIRNGVLDSGWDSRPKSECATGKFHFNIIYYDGWIILIRLHRIYFGVFGFVW